MNKLKSFLKYLFKLEREYKIISYISLAGLLITVNTLRSHSLVLTVENSTLRSEIESLKKNVVFYYRNYENSPFPTWQKKKSGGEFVMQYVNPAYVKTFGHIFAYDRFNLIGKNNFELGYPEPIARSYFENDVAVAITGIPLRSIEQAPDSSGVMMNLKVIKYREIRDKDTLIMGKIYEIYR